MYRSVSIVQVIRQYTDRYLDTSNPIVCIVCPNVCLIGETMVCCERGARGASQSGMRRISVLLFCLDHSSRSRIVHSTSITPSYRSIDDSFVRIILF